MLVITGLITLSLLALLLVVLWKAASTFVMPERRPLEPYHEEWLQADRGFSIDEVLLVDDMVPTLVCRPVATQKPGKRGRILRSQLAERGVTLFSYGEEVGIVAILHGRRGRKEDMLPLAARYTAAGFICIIPDLPGHGASPSDMLGYGSGELDRRIPMDIVREASSALSLPALPRHLWGVSMGGSFAIHAADHDPDYFRSIVLVSSFDRMDHIVTDQIRIYLGPLARPLTDLGCWMIVQQGGPKVSDIRPVMKAENITLPVFMAHGDEDRIISIDHGKALYNAFAGEKTFMEIRGGNHRNIFVTDDPLFANTAEFLLQHN